MLSPGSAKLPCVALAESPTVVGQWQGPEEGPELQQQRLTRPEVLPAVLREGDPHPRWSPGTVLPCFPERSSSQDPSVASLWIFLCFSCILGHMLSRYLPSDRRGCHLWLVSRQIQTTQHITEALGLPQS